MEEYGPYEYNGKTMLVERFLPLMAAECPAGRYDLFDMAPNPAAMAAAEALARVGYGGRECFDANTPAFDALVEAQAENTFLYLYTEIISRASQKVLIYISLPYGCKLYLNGKFIAIHKKSTCNAYYTAALREGSNAMVIERHASSRQFRAYLQVRDHAFEMGGDFRALSQSRCDVAVDPLVLVHEPYSLFDACCGGFRFMYTTNAPERYEDGYSVELLDSRAGHFATMRGRLNEPMHVDAAQMRSLHPDALRRQTFRCCFRTKDGAPQTVSFDACFTDFASQSLNALKDAERLAGESEGQISAMARGLASMLAEAVGSRDTEAEYRVASRLREVCGQIEAGAFPFDFYKRDAGASEFFIISRLDGSPVRVAAHLPPEYGPGTAYPAILALSTGRYDSCSELFADFWGLDEPCLFFDVTGRGVTGGSYCGEASIMEIVAWIKNNYSVDPRRIYMTGYSNGGYATFAIAECHPDLLAAIYPLAGLPDMRMAKNMSSTPVYHFVALNDTIYSGNENDLKNAICKFGNYHQYDLPQASHANVASVRFHAGAFNAMLGERLNPYPRAVSFATLRNRHLKSFWVRLLGIAKGRKYARVKAAVKNPGMISVSLRNADGVALALPPGIDRSAFSVAVNGKAFSFRSYGGDSVAFARKGEQWAIAESEPAIDYRKGTGLLDVYLDALRIILPNNCSDSLAKVACNFSSPSTQGFDPVVYTKYPVCHDSEYSERAPEGNMVLIGCQGQNAVAARISDAYRIQCDGNGFCYNGETVRGCYVVMQAMPNPYNGECTVLAINTNDERLLQKNMFTRKVIIPFYVSGLHPFWNNMALIFDGNDYFGIYEWGMPLEKITQQTK
jgi:pimeloyl-ACP methyl ester carboxylesterase